MAGGRSGSLIAVVAVAVVVVVGALGGAYVLGHHPFGLGAAPVAVAAPATTDAALACAGGPCQLLTGGSAGAYRVQLYAAADGSTGRLRVGGPGAGVGVFEIQISQLGVRLSPHSLTCVSGPVPACVVGGDYQSGVIGELYVDRTGGWQRVSNFIFADGGYLGLRPAVDAAQGPDVVTVRRDCGSARATRCAAPRAYVEVDTVTKDPIGCSKSVPVTQPGQLPAALDLQPARADLRPCPK